MANPFVHVELSTTDLGAAKTFYQALFDWKLDDVDMGGGSHYTMINVGEGTGGGMMTHPMPGAPSAWLPYVLVDDIAAATAKAKSLGATVIRDVMEVMGAGSLSIIKDPTGPCSGCGSPRRVDRPGRSARRWGRTVDWRLVRHYVQFGHGGRMVATRRRLDEASAKGPDRLDATRFAPANRRRLSGPGLRSFLAIADLWGLTEEQRLLVMGLPSRSTYHSWIKTVREHGDGHARGRCAAADFGGAGHPSGARHPVSVGTGRGRLAADAASARQCSGARPPLALSSAAHRTAC